MKPDRPIKRGGGNREYFIRGAFDIQGVIDRSLKKKRNREVPRTGTWEGGGAFEKAFRGKRLEIVKGEKRHRSSKKREEGLGVVMFQMPEKEE